MNSLKDILVENPIVCAIRSDEDLDNAIKSANTIVFVLYGNLISIMNIVKKLKKAEKLVFVHMDLIDGLKSDESAIQYLKENAKTDGIITTKQSVIKLAKVANLLTIIRFFVIDSKSLATGIKSSNDLKPDAIEILPGISEKIITAAYKNTKLPIIAGGLIETKDEVVLALKNGAVAISTSSSKVWEE